MIKAARKAAMATNRLSLPLCTHNLVRANAFFSTFENSLKTEMAELTLTLEWKPDARTPDGTSVLHVEYVLVALHWPVPANRLDSIDPLSVLCILPTIPIPMLCLYGGEEQQGGGGIQCTCRTFRCGYCDLHWTVDATFRGCSRTRRGIVHVPRPQISSFP